MLLNMSNGVHDDSFSSEETANTNHMLEIKHTQTADEKSLNNISGSEGKDPMSSPPHSPQNKGCDSDTSDVQSNLAAGENHLTAHQNDNSLSDAVNTNTTGKDTSKETDFNTGDKRPH